MKHVHISGIHALITALEVIVVIGTLNLVADRYRETSKLAATYLAVMNTQP